MPELNVVVSQFPGVDDLLSRQASAAVEEAFSEAIAAAQRAAYERLKKLEVFGANVSFEVSVKNEVVTKALLARMVLEKKVSDLFK